MKTSNQIILTLTAFVTALVLSGCASSKGYSQADKTGKGIADFRDEVVKLKKAADGAMANLTLTTETAATDPRKAYDAFAKSVGEVEAARARAGKRAADMKAAGEAYFKQWEEQLASIENPDIRKLAESNKTKLSETFKKLGPLLQQAKADFDPFASDLKDLRSYLGQDLTVTGVDSARKIIEKTRKNGVTLQKSLDDLIAEMNSIAATLTAARVPEQKK